MTPAVLLIIGAAVIGPIEGKLIPPLGMTRSLGGDFSTTKAELVCVPTPVPNKGNEINPCRRETVAELCARAMKEIGAVIYRDTSGNMQAVPMFGHIIGTTLGNRGTDVTCIRAPEGYRR